MILTETKNIIFIKHLQSYFFFSKTIPKTHRRILGEGFGVANLQRTKTNK